MSELDRQLRRLGVSLAPTGGEGAVPDAAASSTIIVGVSGGADSVALLLGLVALSRRRSWQGLRIFAAHVHHHLRDDADADAEWVAETCRRFGVELHVQHVEPGLGAGGVGRVGGRTGIAARARTLRYEALARVAKLVGAGFVAVAHHCDDQFETMLMALCRGAGLEGLSGMAPARPLKVAVETGAAGESCYSATLIRPLLGVSRSECENFCHAAGIEWRTDQTNFDVKKVRPRLRRDVTAALEQLWPGAAARAAGITPLLRAAAAALERELARTFGPPSQARWERAGLRALGVPVIAAGLRRAALSLAPEAADRLRQRQLAEVAEAIASDDRCPRRFTWPCGLKVRVTAREIVLLREAATPVTDHGRACA